MTNRGAASAVRVPLSAVILLLLVLQLPGIVLLVSHHAIPKGDVALSAFSIALVLLALVALAGLWLRRAWAHWAALVVISCKLTADLFFWSQGFMPMLTVAGFVLFVAIAALVFAEGAAPARRVTPYQRALFGAVLAFAAWVAVWGLFFPAQIASRLPLTVPPLHARFLGAMYLAGSAFMLLAMLAKQWHEVRVATVILALWTGMLGLVSILNLAALDWSRGPLWFWFVAYIGFPLIALWVAWCQRGETAHPDEREISRGLRAYLYIQGAVSVLLAACLLLAPKFMSTLWPWPVAALVAHIYGAPFLAFGAGSLYAARQQSWSEVRVAVLGTLVFALGVLAASWMHSALFKFATPSAWVWFGGFGIAAAALAAFALWPRLRTAAA